MTDEQHIENLKKLKSFHNGSYGADIDRAIKALEQEPKIGHWIWQTEDIYRCSECGNDIRVKEVMNIPQYVRCPICEAKMQEVEK